MSGRGKGAGTGYPISFLCYRLRRVWPRDSVDYTRHVTTPTGRAKQRSNVGKGNARKAMRSLEYECSCGHVGWSVHIDLARRAVALDLVEEADVIPAAYFQRGRAS